MISPAMSWSRFLEKANFYNAWLKVAANRGCAGVDGETINQFATHAERNLQTLRQAVSEGAYLPLPLRQIWIPKKAGGWRELRVPTVRERIVQQALLTVLHPILEPQFEASSFAYRPGRSHQMAVREVDRWHHKGYNWLLDADIMDYFQNIQYQRLMAEIKERFNHLQISDLLMAWISVGILTKEGLILPQKGIPQGAVVSPILANVYLDDFDEFQLVRYADDFVALDSLGSAAQPERYAAHSTDVSNLVLILRYYKVKLYLWEVRVASASNGQTSIIPTERGLTISGTRITLYDLMDYLTDQYPLKFICALFDLSEEQMDAALAYIEANRTKVEAEYQQVLQEAEELRLYYEEQNRERIIRIPTLPPPPGLEAAWEKLHAAKASYQIQA